MDFLLSEHRDISAAKQFFRGAIELHGAPKKIALDGYPATHVAIAELKKDGVLSPETKVWTSKYLNNLVFESHCIGTSAKRATFYSAQKWKAVNHSP